MSFDIKGPSPKFGIQEAQSMKNNGGGGNLGYFQRRNKEEKDKKKNNNADIFDFSFKDDEFILEADLNNKEKDLLQKAAEFITKFKTKRQGA